MTREYLRVTPTSAGLDPDVVSTAIASLHKLSATDSDSVIARLIPFRSEQPVTFEFLAISDGTNEPVEFYYGVDTKLDVLRQRLRSIYPDSFDIVRKLIQPVEQRPAEFDGRLEEEERLRDPDAADPPSDRNPPIGMDGGTVRARPTNRADSRLGLVLNAEELANLIVVLARRESRPRGRATQNPPLQGWEEVNGYPTEKRGGPEPFSQSRAQLAAYYWVLTVAENPARSTAVMTSSTAVSSPTSTVSVSLSTDA